MIPDLWRKSILILIYKNKGDIVNCGNYRGMKLYERVHENRLRNIVSISEGQFGFVKGKSTTDAIFALRQLQERYREGQQDLHCVFIDLEKDYDRVPRVCYRNKRTLCSVEVGLHQGSAFSPFLFAIMMDSLTENIRKKHHGR